MMSKKFYVFHIGFFESIWNLEICTQFLPFYTYQVFPHIYLGEELWMI